MIEIIPAIDILDGACVRLRQGRYDTPAVYDKDPAAVARRFENAGIRRLHCVDLDGARAGHPVNIAVIEKICRETSLAVDLGGGIKSDDDIRRAFDAGVRQVTAGSLAVADPAKVLEWLKTYGPGKIILGADFRGERIAVSGWRRDSERSLEEFLEYYVSRGIRSVISTDISRDGMLAGSAAQRYADIKKRFPEIFLIASGGIAGMEDVRELDRKGIDGVIVGKAIYEKRIDPEEIGAYIGSC